MTDDTPINWRDLPPLPEAEIPKLPEIPSMTFLKHFERCERAALLYAKYRGGAGAHEMNRGDVFHIVAERIANDLIEQAHSAEPGGSYETMFPPDVGKDILREVLRDYPGPIPADERDALRGMVFNFCSHWAIEPTRVIGVEQMLELDVGGFTIRGKVDLLQHLDVDYIEVVDYKTSFAIPDSDEFARGGLRHDGSHKFGGDFQTIVYALLVAFGRTPDGLHYGDGLRRFRLRLVFPRTVRESGELASVDAEIGREQLVDFMGDLEDLLARLDRSIKTRKWQATPGDRQCDECPAKVECPLPAALRPEDPVGEIETIEDLEREAARWEFGDKRSKARKRAIKAASKRLNVEMIRIGRDIALVHKFREGEEIKSKPKLRYAVDEAVEFGRGLTEEGEFDWERHVKTTQGTRFERLRVDPLPTPTDDSDDDDDEGNPE